MACVGTRGGAGLSGGLVLVLGGRVEPPPGQAQGPRIHLPTSPCPYARTHAPGSIRDIYCIPTICCDKMTLMECLLRVFSYLFCINGTKIEKMNGYCCETVLFSDF